jgi:hypothetical protein
MTVHLPLLNPTPGGPQTVEIDPIAIHQVSPLGRSACRVLHGADAATRVWVEVRVGLIAVLQHIHAPEAWKVPA